MRTSELVVLGYLSYLLVLAWSWRIGGRRRALVTVTTVADGALILALARSVGQVQEVARDWVPGLHLLVGYWLSGAFFLAPSHGFEAWLEAWDRRVFRDWRLSTVGRRAGRALLEYLELAYLSVYAMVPAGFVVLYWWGHRGEREVEAYWTAVLVTGYICYGLLPWLPSRPPIERGLHLEVDARALWIRRFNLAIRRTASVQANTFPSGHAATAWAVALAAGTLVPGALVPLVILAGSITVASVVGRYHYAMDAITGVILALAVWAYFHG